MLLYTCLIILLLAIKIILSAFKSLWQQLLYNYLLIPYLKKWCYINRHNLPSAHIIQLICRLHICSIINFHICKDKPLHSLLYITCNTTVTSLEPRRLLNWFHYLQWLLRNTNVRTTQQGPVFGDRRDHSLHWHEGSVKSRLTAAAADWKEAVKRQKKTPALSKCHSAFRRPNT